MGCACTHTDIVTYGQADIKRSLIINTAYFSFQIMNVDDGNTNSYLITEVNI